MNNRTNRTLLELLMVVALMALVLVAMVLPAQAADTFQPNRYDNVLTNGVTTVTNAATATVAGKPFTLRQGQGFGVFTTFVGTNAGTANMITKWDVSYDGTTYTTTQPLRATNAMNNTTAVRGWTWFSPQQVDGVRTIKLTGIGNEHTASLLVTNVIVSYPNASGP